MRKIVLAAIAALSISVLSAAETPMSVDQITVINLGDGRLLFRNAEDKSPLEGEHRIIDGYRSEYILAEFHEGLYDGKYEHYRRNALVESGTYKAGVKSGIFRDYYSDGKSVKAERPITDGKIDGLYKEYSQDGKLYKEKGYKMAVEHGVEKVYNPDGTLKIEGKYFEGKKDGRWVIDYTSNVGDYREIASFDKGVSTGEFSQTWTSGIVRTKGSYKDGKKEGKWINNKKDGMPQDEKSYKNGVLSGESKTFFTDGTVEKVTTYANDKKNGPEKEYYYNSGGKLKAEYTYADNVKEGPYKRFNDDGSLREEGRFQKGSEVYVKEYYKGGKVKSVKERASGSWKTLESYDSNGNKLQ